MAGLILDSILILLLVAAVGYGVRLEKKLTVLRDGQAAFGKAVGELNGAAGRAESALASLRAAGEEADLLHDRIMKARALKDELEVLIRKAPRAEAARIDAPLAEPATPAPRSVVEKAPISPPAESRSRIETLFAEARGRLDRHSGEAQRPVATTAESLFEEQPRARPVLQALAANHAAQQSLNRARRNLDEDLFAA
ncbi:DUF6468 domain-containing protein [Brevundimonas lutea]|uniref:DUF6468 domain-containing protein n=1 Tax=Brevundimonas lutea TaxID=2293980 RepID=UPI000F025120|nr:DUF6468 domain-containing protein [Brevundimonas lutea]